MRTGHNRLNARMYSKFKFGESEMCACDADIMTAEHLLQHCQLCDALRQDMWPEPKPLRDKLYGNLEELKRTAAFVRATGVSVRRTRKKKKTSPPSSSHPPEPPPSPLLSHCVHQESEIKNRERCIISEQRNYISCSNKQFSTHQINQGNW